MKVRYIGPDDTRDVSLPDGDTIRLERMAWLDTTEDHAVGFAGQDEWELDAEAKRAVKAAAKNTGEDETPGEAAPSEQADAADAADTEES